MFRKQVYTKDVEFALVEEAIAIAHLQSNKASISTVSFINLDERSFSSSYENMALISLISSINC